MWSGYSSIIGSVVMQIHSLAWIMKPVYRNVTKRLLISAGNLPRGSQWVILPPPPAAGREGVARNIAGHTPRPLLGEIWLSRSHSALGDRNIKFSCKYSNLCVWLCDWVSPLQFCWKFLCFAFPAEWTFSACFHISLLRDRSKCIRMEAVKLCVPINFALSVFAFQRKKPKWAAPVKSCWWK